MDTDLRQNPKDNGMHHRQRDSRRRLVKIALTGIGVLAVGVGTLGLFVPLLPTTPFLLLAAACFVRSSDRLYGWLLNHRWFGTYIRNYREHRAVPRRVKMLSLILLWSTIGFSACRVVDAFWVRALLLLVAVGVTVHLVRLKTLDT